MPEFLDKFTGHQLYEEPLPEDRELEKFFTDAEYARQVFEDLIKSAALSKRLLVIHGMGGVGKSTLLKMYRLSCYRNCIPVALVDAEVPISSIDVLVNWSDDLSRMGIKLQTFGRMLKRYRDLQSKVDEKSKKANETIRTAAEKMSKAAVKTVVEMAASTIPVIGPVAAALGGKGAEAAVDWLRGFLKKPDLEFYLDPQEQLNKNFMVDLNRTAKHHRIVLILDTYEQMVTLDNWLRELTQRLPENVLLVIAGRTIPSWDRNWPGWMGQAKIVALKEMTSDEQHTLVNRYYAYISGSKPDPKQVKAILEFSRGLPIAATTVVQLWVKYGVEDFHTVKSQVVADLVDRLLEGVPTEIRPAFETAAVLRYFNADSLQALIDSCEIDELYSELKRWPFITPRKNCFAMHDTMREMINEALSIRSPLRFRALHERAVLYYGTRRIEITGSEKESATLEMLYHQLHHDENKGAFLLEKLFEEADRLWKKDLQQKLLKEASQYDFKEAKNLYLQQYLQTQMMKDWAERERIYKELLSKDINDTIRPTVLRSLSEALSFQGKSEEASEYLQRALEICERLGDPIVTAWIRLDLSWRIKDLNESLNHTILALKAFREVGNEYGIAMGEFEMGYIYINRWQANEARQAFTRSMTLQEGLGNLHSAAMAMERIGQTYLIEGDFLQAIASKEKALMIFEDLQDEWSVAWTLDELATCYSWTGQWELALASIDRARIIFAEWNDHRETACVVRKGEIYRKQGRLELAMEMYKHALYSMPRHNVWATQEIYAGMGYIHLMHGEFDDALTNYQQVIIEFREEGKEFEADLVGNVYLGNLYLVQGRFIDALNYFALALKVAQSRNQYGFQCLSLVGMCQSNFRLGNFEQLKDMLIRAKELGQTYRYNHFLADINLLQGHIAIDRKRLDYRLLNSAINFYSDSLKYALLYNRYKLDETIKDIITYCHEKGVEDTQVLTALRNFWQNNNDNKGIPLLEAERIAREQEVGDGITQMSLVEQIEMALLK